MDNKDNYIKAITARTIIDNFNEFCSDNKLFELREVDDGIAIVIKRCHQNKNKWLINGLLKN